MATTTPCSALFHQLSIPAAACSQKYSRIRPHPDEAGQAAVGRARSRPTPPITAVAAAVRSTNVSGIGPSIKAAGLA